MKKLLSLLILSVFLVSSCSDGERGPEGPQGPPGEPGINIVGQTFEFEDIDFDYNAEDNLHTYLLNIPEDIEVIESDAILVYRLEVAPTDDGGSVETWSLIPQNFFLDQGTMQYVYNHTAVDVQLLIDGNFDLSTLSDDFTQDQVFRFVVVPSDFIAEAGIDANNFQAVMNALNLEEQDIQQVRSIN
ncbi:collagen-like protein [Salegentibacter chungangensis]|uniref:Collagen-like protein n=1 Tax=Salegentibacter chungangensis TaxID=1335724 RepID=A0ABW3NQT0_9FLAO